jgi:hypothetical protein
MIDGALPGMFDEVLLYPRHSGTRAKRVDPESRATFVLPWIPGSALRTAPE